MFDLFYVHIVASFGNSSSKIDVFEMWILNNYAETQVYS